MQRRPRGSGPAASTAPPGGGRLRPAPPSPAPPPAAPRPRARPRRWRMVAAARRGALLLLLAALGACRPRAARTGECAPRPLLPAPPRPGDPRLTPGARCPSRPGGGVPQHRRALPRAAAPGSGPGRAVGRGCPGPGLGAPGGLEPRERLRSGEGFPGGGRRGVLGAARGDGPRAGWGTSLGAVPPALPPAVPQRSPFRSGTGPRARGPGRPGAVPGSPRAGTPPERRRERTRRCSALRSGGCAGRTNKWSRSAARAAGMRQPGQGAATPPLLCAVLSEHPSGDVFAGAAPAFLFLYSSLPSSSVRGLLSLFFGGFCFVLKAWLSARSSAGFGACPGLRAGL